MYSKALNLTLITLEEAIQDCVKTANSAAFKVIYQHYADKMFFVCLRYIGDEADAADVLQESFIQAFNKIGTVKEPESFEGWFRRIVVNKCLEFLRSKSKQQELFERYVQENEAEEHVSLVEENESKLRSTLFSAIRALPIGYRTIINLSMVEGYSHGEIAGMLGVAESTSRSQLARARAQLKKILIKKQVDIIKEFYYG